MDIIFGDNMKRELRAMMWLLKRRLKNHYKVTLEQVREDMDNCGNPVIWNIWKEIRDAAEQIEENYQKEIAIEFPMIILWIIYKDTAYNPIFMYILVKLMEQSDLILPKAKKYYVEPKDWYVNRWHDTKQHTKDLKEEGKIPNIDGVLAPDEMIFVPQAQNKEHMELSKSLEEELEDYKKKKGWKHA